MMIIPREGEQRTNTNLRTQPGCLCGFVDSRLSFDPLFYFSREYYCYSSRPARLYLCSDVARGEAYGSSVLPPCSKSRRYTHVFQSLPLCTPSHGHPSHFKPPSQKK
ncbi:hypothetical protein IscW_ISCW003916 [Ixodes scapularis]|uniref:Uncharacterized protein n=1 Tax=Ixodes scapularis TaxID=6945 RepID=B7PJS3_IXOSC|nr:hypothetical protein IscW_ISCW003916 [Ixodes scapularis]|eukprot:XP_002408437.1 hypothetical protein IscW_ISCW003916 [Ixodes scapularis]